MTAIAAIPIGSAMPGNHPVPTAIDSPTASGATTAATLE